MGVSAHPYKKKDKNQINTDWYGYLVNTGVGKFVVALSYLVTFLSFIHVVKVTQPTNEM